MIIPARGTGVFFHNTYSGKLRIKSIPSIRTALYPICVPLPVI